jgi:type I restriction enzyme R subunit
MFLCWYFTEEAYRTPYDITDETIAESNNFIVLDKYVTEWEAGDQSEAELERELIQDLRNQGYEFVPDLTSQQAMLANVRIQLQNLNQGQIF